MGVIATAKAKATERRTEAEDDAMRGLVLRRGVQLVIARFLPSVVAQEGASGSKSARAAVALARAQQACVDAVDEALGSLPIFVTQQAAKTATVGRHANVSKADLERSARERWAGTDFAALLAAGPTPKAPPSEHENAYDALCVAAAVWDHPSVALLRARSSR